MTAAQSWRQRCDDALRNPTPEAAADVWCTELVGPPDNPEDPQTALHLARLKWEHSTAEMVEESRRWLAERSILPVIDLPEMNQ